ncbi:tripartite tricarboxylate transporter TctB family protein [Crassaminicella profunda]|uniref:tripartite tricarboxylate transporter TctB family protein n=1 Tax=Crassaminicella profunda TaxID=1286698 RepID=UPI001CA75A34|nr:tripartite tricarboxylate transporter TctB family protein [Crassaminicella profunda]QZY53615.1 tripartite tricarboxylate transporter TctB family protein [Crassaminicella profunda]
MDKSKKKLDFNGLTGLVTLIIALIYGFMAYTLPKAAIGNPMAPAMYPLILAGTLGILGMILLLKSDLKKSIASFEILKKEATDQDRLNWKMITRTCCFAIVYAIAFDYLGYVLSTFIFLQMMLILVNGKEKWKVNTIVALFFSVGIYMIFSKLLGIYLPQIPYLYI